MKRALLAAALLAACSDPNDPKALRNLGEECVSCHRPGAKAAQWPFTAGGTVYRTREDENPGLADVEITLTDGRGKVLVLRSNRAGNFFTREQLQFPVAVRLRRQDGEGVAEVPAGPCNDGGCNGCHALPPRNGARGRLHAPR